MDPNSKVKFKYSHSNLGYNQMNQNQENPLNSPPCNFGGFQSESTGNFQIKLFCCYLHECYWISFSLFNHP